MPRHRSNALDALLKYWPLLVGGASVIGALLTWQAGRDAQRVVIEQQCQRIETLERLFVSEYPSYTPALYYLHAPTC